MHKYWESRGKPIFEKWRAKPIQRELYIPKYCTLLTIGILTSAILENIVYHWKLFPVFERNEGKVTFFANYCTAS